MRKIKIGIIGCSEIAFRRFLPALKESNYFEYVGVASRELAKTQRFINEYGGKGYGSYDEILDEQDIDALYIPLPPALHYIWAKRALESGKHVLLEKPFTTNELESFELIKLAKKNNLAIFENYMFKYHSQLKFIRDMIATGEIGELRGYRIAFGFPMRDRNDFRYSKNLGGGSLLDCGGYTIKLANILLGKSTKVMYSKLNKLNGFEVDIFGVAILQNESGITAEVSFGMDNAYKCELEVWGSKASIMASRIFTAPDGFKPEIIIKNSVDTTLIELESDNQFLNSINDFYRCIWNLEYRECIAEEIRIQASTIEEIKAKNQGGNSVL